MAIKRIADEPAYVLHRYDWSETSLILDVFTRHHGRVALVAKGAKRPSSSFRSVLLPLQALSLMINSLVFAMADDFAARVIRDAGADTNQQIELVYSMAFGREADPDDITTANDFVAEHGLASFCRVILNSNEVLYLR